MLGVASTLVKRHAVLQLENVALRHQIGVLQRPFERAAQAAAGLHGAAMYTAPSTISFPA